MTEDSVQRTRLIPDQRIGITLCIFGLIGNLFFILRDIPPIVGITLRVHGCKCGIYAKLIIIGLRIYTKKCVDVVGDVREWDGSRV